MSLRFSSCRVFFFFQAEDGIRDGTVTGVQTCALPISGWGGWARTWWNAWSVADTAWWVTIVTQPPWRGWFQRAPRAQIHWRNWRENSRGPEPFGSWFHRAPLSMKQLRRSCPNLLRTIF